MNRPKISLIASAARPAFWQRFYTSLLGNTVDFEIIFVGPNAPDFVLPQNFKFYESKVKPAQCYEFAIRVAQGDLIGWTADDANYNHPKCMCPNALDIIWQEYVSSQNPKLILAMRTLEDGNDVSEDHRFFFGDKATPRMAPLGFINREWLLELGGYDRNFICGQSENDVVMRAILDGGEVKLLDEARVYLQHAECHGTYQFRSAYDADREFLENCWVKEGYGTYQVSAANLSAHRLRPFEPFSNSQILVVNQGPAGRWEM